MNYNVWKQNRTCKIENFNIGMFCSIARNNKVHVNEEMRKRFLEIDPKFFKK